MLSYMDALTVEQLKHMHGAIRVFLDGYVANGIGRGAQQKTVLFFPGGLGSELSQADEAFDANAQLDLGGNTVYQYNQFWYDAVKILGRAALRMQMRRENGVDYDSDRCFILASGEMDNCVYPPYDGFVDWCRNNDLDLLVCGWDNRRDGDWLVRFFLNDFPNYVRQCAAAAPYNIDISVNDPLRNVYLVGHSEGGMLIKWMLNIHWHEFVRNVRRAITVATPFYGTVSQCHRLFEGEPQVVGNYTKAELATAIATMPGGYSLFLLDSQTYDDNRGKLAADAAYPLLEYPSLDANDYSRVDPYDPGLHEVRDDGRRRYPNFGWDISPYVAEGLRQYQLTAQELDDSVKDRFHNVRGVQTQGGADYPGTPGSLFWDWIPEAFNPNDGPSPIHDGPGVPGDGAIPAWSARLVTQDSDNVHTVRGDVNDFEHMFLMESDVVLSKLWQLLQMDQPRRDSQRIMERRAIEPASAIELVEASREMQQFARDRRSLEVRANIGNMDENRRKALGKRWYIERAKGPRPEPAKRRGPPQK